jgi:hypothetical protein
MPLPTALAAELSHWSALPTGERRWGRGASALAARAPGRGRVDEAWRSVGPPVPRQLVEVWRIHDGIGRAGDARTPLLPPRLRCAADARPLSAVVRFGENDVLFAPASWWWVADLGAYGGCVDGQGRSAKWMPDRHELGPPEPLDALFDALADAFARYRDQAE